eukprot:5837341-Amphidinium_carterae.1
MPARESVVIGSPCVRDLLAVAGRLRLQRQITLWVFSCKPGALGWMVIYGGSFYKRTAIRERFDVDLVLLISSDSRT